VKIVFNCSDGSENFFIFSMGNSIEFESELKLRISAMVSKNPKAKPPTTMYVGVFAGATKPKPFQRKRPNLSRLPPGKLPPLHTMRETALDLHQGSYRPCPQGHSRRVEIAFQHIYEGANAFFLLNVRGPPAVSNQWHNDSTLTITEDALIFKPHGTLSETKLEFAYSDIDDWRFIDNEFRGSNGSGIEVVSTAGDTVFFGVEFVRDVKHTLEYFWNKYKVRAGHPEGVKLGSTHGRPLVSISTLTGEQPAPAEDPALGSSQVVDMDGAVVRVGGKLAPRSNRGEATPVPPINRDVSGHWNQVVLHQGWLLKQGGIGVGANKSWIKRYFVLYKTSQGHFLVYYSDLTECPLFTAEKNHRNFVDMAKCSFIRPGSNKKDNPDTPPHCFDIVTIERDWTLCAESHDNAQRWLKLLTKAVDEDVAILPDEEVVFKVKPKVDPLGVLPSTDYTTSLKVSAHGISVTTPHKEKEGQDIEHYFWLYTDFYKWTLISQAGKLALLVNVFADASFSRRIEYIFRNRDAQRLATAIEFFIEKFMTVAHIRVETMADAFQEGEEGAGGAGGARMHELNAEDVAQENQAQYGDEIDLLGMDLLELELNSGAATSAPTTAASLQPAGGTDVFSTKGSARSLDIYGSEDPFGEVSAPPTQSAPAGVAPPLTAEQVAQHRRWMLSAVSVNGGPLYDDGTLQVATKIETRGSQCRFSFMHINQSPAAITDFKVTVADPAGLMRFELSPLQSSQLDGLARATQVMMLECVGVVPVAPQVTFSYVDPELGRRTSTLDLPLVITTFNEPLSLTAEDFAPRWQQLAAPGQEAQEVLKLPYPVVPAQVHGVLSSVRHHFAVPAFQQATEL
jgi:hypothetical protein